MSDFNRELYNQFEYEGKIRGHTTSGIALVLLWEVCPEYITYSPARYIMDLHTLKRQVVAEVLSSNSDKEY
jgi:hypothetical protein